MSTGLELYVDVIDHRMHAAVVLRGKLYDLYVDGKANEASWASLYNGRVTRIDAALNAAIVDLGKGVQGFLPSKHVFFPGHPRTQVKPGQNILVQIKSEARHGPVHEHQKLPRLTMKLHMLGPRLILCPLGHRIAVKHRAQDAKIAEIEKKLGGSEGWVVQPQAARANERQIADEAARLRHAWKMIEAENAKSPDTPRLLCTGPDTLERVLTDYGPEVFDHIYIGTRDIFTRMEAWCETFSPNLSTSKRLRLFKPEPQGAKHLFDICDIYSQMQGIDDDLVPLAGGGSIIIEQTHSMTVIDVNLGAARSVSECNREAAMEVARQIRLRNLSGAILIDFINMNSKNERFQLVETLASAFGNDKAGTQVHGFTRLGIIELTRKRGTPTRAEKLRVILQKSG